MLSTSPFSYYTHWKQTAFYLREALELRIDDVISGTFAMGSNKESPRTQDIRIEFSQSGNEESAAVLKYHLR